MKKPLFGINRIIDANANRAAEGLRVCEEITRFILNNKNLTSRFKIIRHGLKDAVDLLSKKKSRLEERQSNRDIGRIDKQDALKRMGYGDIFFANIQRVKESLRVLEEFAKLSKPKAAIKFKELRYKVYTLEKISNNNIEK